MKKAKNVGRIVLVILLVNLLLATLIELCIWYFGVMDTLVGLGITGFLGLILIISETDKGSNDHRKRARDKQILTDEAFRQKYCK